MYQLIDSHCHLDFEQFDEDREVLIDGLLAKDVTDVIVPGVHQGNWQRVLDLAAKYEHIHPALGIHPCFMAKSKHSHIDDLAAMVEQHKDKLVAIGECGLDFSLEDIEPQRFYFAEQIKLAQEHKLPLIIHHRNSNDIVLAFLRKYKPEAGGVIHAFSGSEQQARQYIDLGFKLGLGGTITYPRAQKTREVVTKVPLESLILETDAPDMPIYGRQGKRNSPQYLGEIFTVLTLLRDEPAVEMAAQLRLNTQQLFNLG
jgi:TatD DNase family protein